MTLARDGYKEMLLSTLFIGGAGGIATWYAVDRTPWLWTAAIPLIAVWAFTLLFFRVPRRIVPSTPGTLISPADGTITEITQLDTHPEIDGAATRIGIFLSVFDVHVNCAPCDGRVRSVTYRRGEFLDARHPECGIRNEANTLVIDPDDGNGPFVVRQIAGLIARRIVCHLRSGDRIRRGARFGLIKFGSRTELIVPAHSGWAAAVKIGDHVKGGETVLMTLSTLNKTGAPPPAHREVAHVA